MSVALWLTGALVIFQEFIREGCLHKLTKKGLQQRMFFLVMFPQTAFPLWEESVGKILSRPPSACSLSPKKLHPRWQLRVAWELRRSSGE